MCFGQIVDRLLGYRRNRQAVAVLKFLAKEPVRLNVVFFSLGYFLQLKMSELYGQLLASRYSLGQW
jgi:hypothetical protein